MKSQCENCGLCIADPLCSPGRVILRNTSWKKMNLCENCCNFFSLKPCFTCSDENNIYWFDTTVGGGVNIRAEPECWNCNITDIFSEMKV